MDKPFETVLTHYTTLPLNLIKQKYLYLIEWAFDKTDQNIYAVTVLELSSPIVNFPFLEGDIPFAPSYVVYISQLVCFIHVCTDVLEFNEHNLYIQKIIKSRISLPHVSSYFYKILLDFTCRKLII